MRRRVGVLMLCAALACSPRAEPDAGVDAGLDGGVDAGGEEPDAGPVCITPRSQAVISDTTPLYPCPGRMVPSETPQVGLCAAGFFPDFDIACGPPYGEEDGGWYCGCSPGLGSGDAGCRSRCTCDSECDSGEHCVRVDLRWGSDVPLAMDWPVPAALSAARLPEGGSGWLLRRLGSPA